MAISGSLRLPMLLFILVGASLCVLRSGARTQPKLAGGDRGGTGWKVGGRTPIRDVMDNKEVQDLGMFAVREHNRRLRPGGDCLVFSRVVRAERQVVSGVKYYLRVAAASEREAAGGPAHYFDAVVVVQPWLDSRDLLSFAPSSHSPRQQCY